MRIDCELPDLDADVLKAEMRGNFVKACSEMIACASRERLTRQEADECSAIARDARLRVDHIRLTYKALFGEELYQEDRACPKP